MKWELVTCTCTDVHRDSNVMYVVVNLALKKILGNMLQRSTEPFIVMTSNFKTIMKGYWKPTNITNTLASSLAATAGTNIIETAIVFVHQNLLLISQKVLHLDKTL